MMKVGIIDFGSQYTHLVCRKIRELGYPAEIVQQPGPEHSVIVLSGGPSSVYDMDAPQIEFEIDRPVLGICYGMQLLVQKYGGTVQPSPKKGYGKKKVTLYDNALDVWFSHGDAAVSVGELQIVGCSDDGIIAAVSHPKLPILGLQFHPEVHHTIRGMEVLNEFIKPYLQPSWYQSIQEEVSKHIDVDGPCLCAFSGGVDSLVASEVMRRNGVPVKNVLVDHGLFRKNEVEDIAVACNLINMDLDIIDAKDIFFSALKGVVDPEQKRKVIGKKFIESFDSYVRNSTVCYKYLVQGTIYPDRIESGVTKNSQVIKSHHNVGGLPDHLNLKIVEPLQDLYKDEVRQLGLELGLPPELIRRRPFPGPGLAVRILGEITQEKVDILQNCDLIVQRAAEKHMWKGWQIFTVLLDSYSVGVQGDGRTWKPSVAIRSVQSVDGMTADPEPINIEQLIEVATRIPNSEPRVGRVLYDLSSKPPASIEWL